MLRTGTMVSSVSEVPREWVFEYYLKLSVRLHGQDVKMHSPFNVGGDKLPSFFVYYAKPGNKYMFKDFSTDLQGDGVTLVQEMFKLSTRGEAAHLVIEDYNKFNLANPGSTRAVAFREEARYKVGAFTTRSWNKLDEKFWMSFKIGSKLLGHYRVVPLKDYTLIKDHPGGKRETRLMNQTTMYGYFKADGTLYKIYQPYIRTKFIKVCEHIQGMDQLKYDKDYLIIHSSLKDIMSFTRLGIKNAEHVAPDSENILIADHIMEGWKKKYKKICTLFDNDAAGIKSMQKYERVYGVPYVHVVLEKDTSDNVKEHGIENTRIHVYPLLTNALTGKTIQV